jgi:hypothetical protein
VPRRGRDAHSGDPAGGVGVERDDVLGGQPLRIDDRLHRRRSSRVSRRKQAADAAANTVGADRGADRVGRRERRGAVEARVATVARWTMP